ncbi:MAG: SPRY domain-containing protein [Flammeovirgaceae bacterium]
MHRNRVEEYSSGFSRGDIVGVHVDLSAGTLEFSKNGKMLGLAFSDVKGPLTPCISLLKGQRVTLHDRFNASALPALSNSNQ